MNIICKFLNERVWPFKVIYQQKNDIAALTSDKISLEKALDNVKDDLDFIVNRQITSFGDLFTIRNVEQKYRSQPAVIHFQQNLAYEIDKLRLPSTLSALNEIEYTVSSVVLEPHLYSYNQIVDSAISPDGLYQVIEGMRAALREHIADVFAKRIAYDFKKLITSEE